MKDEKIDESKMAQNLINQAFSVWINPELERRKKANLLPTGFSLQYAQIIFTLSGKNLVRINSEVKTIIKAKVNQAVKKGQPITASMIDNLESFSLIDEEKDFGHLTLAKLQSTWHVGFDFRYNLSKPREFHAIGKDFLSQAKKALDGKNYRPMVECLFIGAENLLKAKLFLYPDETIRKAKTHQGVQMRVNHHARTTKILTEDHRNTFNELTSLRDKARYDTAFKITEQEAQDMFKVIKELS